MKNFITLLFVTLFIPTLSGCNSKDASADEQDKKVAYYCRETKKIVVTTKQETPALNPETGKKTLSPTMYCEKCKKWRPVPPMEILQRNPATRVCRQCKKLLVAEGPLPEKKK